MMTNATTTTSLRLLFVTARYFPVIGGIENHVYQVAGRLAQRGVAVTVLTTDREGQLPSHEVVDGVQIRRVRAWPAERDYYIAPALASVVAAGGWDIVHCQGYHTFVPPVAMAAAARASIPYLMTFHGGGHSSRLRNRIRGLQRWLLRPLFARAARLVATASFEYELFGDRLRIPRERFVYIPNGCDLAAPARPVARRTDRTIITSVGRLEEYKGHHRILAAMPYLLRRRPDIHLWIAGSGPYEAALRRQAAQLGVADRVEIRAVPAADRAAMATGLAEASLMVLLSEYETHPMAALEALAIGCPALVADTSGLRELAQRGWARAIPLTSQPEEVAVAVLAQLDEPIQPVRIELPTWDDCVDQLLTVYGQLAPHRVLPTSIARPDLPSAALREGTHARLF